MLTSQVKQVALAFDNGLYGVNQVNLIGDVCANQNIATFIQQPDDWLVMAGPVNGTCYGVFDVSSMPSLQGTVVVQNSSNGLRVRGMIGKPKP